MKKEDVMIVAIAVVGQPVGGDIRTIYSESALKEMAAHDSSLDYKDGTLYKTF